MVSCENIGGGLPSSAFAFTRRCNVKHCNFTITFASDKFHVYFSVYFKANLSTPRIGGTNGGTNNGGIKGTAMLQMAAAVTAMNQSKV
jgi:hypothetical protein